MSDAVVGALRVVTGLDNSDFQKGLQVSAQASGHFKKAVGQDMADIEKSMQRPELAMKRLEASLRGDKLLASAGRLTDAIVKIGGASKLTEAEQAKANLTLQKAIEKYRAMGQEAPMAMKYIEAATRKATAATEAHGVSVDKMAEGMRRMGDIGKASFDKLAAGQRLSAGMSSAGRAAEAMKAKAAIDAEAASVDKLAKGWQRMGELGRANLDRSILNERLLAGMSAAGRDAAKAHVTQLSALDKVASGVNRGMNALSGTVGQMVAGFTLANVAMRSFNGVVNLGLQAVETADRLVDMSATTGLSTELLQRLDFVADQAGGTLDNFTRAVFQLGVRLTGGSSGVNKAVSELGMNLAELKRSKPDEQFLKIVDALSKVENEQERNRIGMALFGKQYASIASAVAQNIRDIGSAASVMSDEHVKALADAKDEWGRFYRDLVIMSGTWLARWRQDIIDAKNGWSAFFEDMASRSVPFRQAMLIGPSEWHGSRIGKGDVALPKDTSLDRAAAPAKSAVERLRELDAQLAKLTKTERAEIDAALDLGEAHDELEAQFGLGEGAIGRYIAKQKDATKATKDLAKESEEAARKQAEFNKELTQRVGTDAIESAFHELDLMDAAAKQGVPLEQFSLDSIERARDAFGDAIKVFTRLGLEVPAQIAAAFQRSAAALANNAEYIAKFAPMDASGLVGSPVVGGAVGMAPWRQALMEADFAQGAFAADLTGGILDPSGLEGLTVAADGTVMRFKDLNYWMGSLNDNLDRLDSPQAPLQAWIQSADILSRSLDQAGLSVSRYIDSVMVAQQAGMMLRQGGLNNRVAGGLMAAGALASSTSSGPASSRILGGAASGAMTTAALTGSLAATGAKLGSWGGWAGIAAGAGIGAAIGFFRSRTVGKEEKEARAAFADWQKQVIANFDAMARQQGRLIDGMTDWDKMVAAVAEAYTATGRSLEDLHHDMKVLSDSTHGSAQDVLGVLGHINGVLNEQAADTQILNDALAEYGFTLDEIGEKQIGKTQTAEAKRLAEQYRVLLDAGVDVAAVHERMSGSISKWLQDTMRTGAAIPSVMEPILANFAKQGQLIDENGLLLDEAAVHALDFKDTWVDGLDRIVVKLDQVLSRFAQLLGIPTDTLTAAQESINSAAPAPPQVKTFNTPFGPLTVTTKHTGGMVERAHTGAFIGSRALPRSLFGRLAADEMPMVLQTGEGVTSRLATAMMGGRSWVNAVNRGDVSSAVSMMTGGVSPRQQAFDPFADMGRLIDMPNRFMPAAAMTPTPSPITTRSFDGGGTVLNLTIESGAVQMVGTGNSKHDGDAILDTVIDGVHNNRRGFRTKLIDKVAKGH